MEALPRRNKRPAGGLRRAGAPVEYLSRSKVDHDTLGPNTRLGGPLDVGSHPSSVLSEGSRPSPSGRSRPRTPARSRPPSPGSGGRNPPSSTSATSRSRGRAAASVSSPRSSGEFAGYVTLDWRSPYPPFRGAGIPEVHDLNVLPRFQRRGLGAALVRAAEDAARQRADVVGIGVGLGPDYGAAQRLYVRLGYVPDGRGVSYARRVVEPGERVVVDDDLVLHFTKRLAGEPAVEGR